MSTISATDPRDEVGSSDIHPVVSLPRQGIPAAALAVTAMLLAIALFIFLDARRRTTENDQWERPGPITLPQAPPPLAIPPAAAPAPAMPMIVHEAVPPPAAAPLARQPIPVSLPPPLPIYRPASRMIDDQTLRRPETLAANPQGGSSAALVVDLTGGKGAPVSSGRTDAASAGAETDNEAVRASLIRNRSVIVPQGAIIAGVLETSLNSDRPGMARAIVSEDVRSFDGSRVLIPRGSRLVGEFKADASPNMRRILVTWDRLIRPDGAAIRIGSPASDAMGGSGIPGSVNTHFFERFAGAILQSALSIGVNLASRPRSGSDAIYVGLPYQATTVGQQLVPTNGRPPTIKVREGAQIAVFVARDLDFGGTPAVR